MKKKIICVIMAFVMMIEMACVPFESQAKEVSFGVIPREAVEYAEENMKCVYPESLTTCFDDEWGVSEEDELELGNPFVVYDDAEVQDEVYYFPLVDKSGSIKKMMSVIGTTDGWTCAFSSEWIDEVKNNIGDRTIDEYYMTSDRLYSEKEILKYENKDLDLKRIIADKRRGLKCLRKIDIKRIQALRIDSPAKYSPGFKHNSERSKQLKLYNEKGQGREGLCWAASTATIINYLNGTNIHPRTIADVEGIPYDNGGYIEDAVDAMSKYRVVYKAHGGPSSIEIVKFNIKNKRPLFVYSTSGIHSGHAVTCYGYDHPNGQPYVYLWNPGENSGSGDCIKVKFLTTGTTFPYNNKVFAWKKYASQYD